MLQRQNINNQNNSRFTPATELKIRTFVLFLIFTTQKGISKNLQRLRKKSYQIIDKPTDVTYKLTDSSKNEIIQHRNNLLPHYPKEYALRKLTQFYSFTGLKIVQNNSEIEQNQNTDKNMKSKPTEQKEFFHQSSLKPETKTSPKEKK